MQVLKQLLFHPIFHPLNNIPNRYLPINRYISNLFGLELLEQFQLVLDMEIDLFHVNELGLLVFKSVLGEDQFLLFLVREVTVVGDVAEKTEVFGCQWCWGVGEMFWDGDVDVHFWGGYYIMMI